MVEKVEADVYGDHGGSYQSARDVLGRECTYPPSFEVFKHEVEERRRKDPHLSILDAARFVGCKYRERDLPEPAIGCGHETFFVRGANVCPFCDEMELWPKRGGLGAG